MAIPFKRKLSLAWKFLRSNRELPMVDNELTLLLNDLKDDQAETQKLLNGYVRELVEFLLISGNEAPANTLGYLADITARLSRDQVLSPLTGKDNEWIETIAATSGAENRRINARKPSVFILGNVAYDGEAIGLVYPDGFVSYKRVEITFPYWPATKHIFVDKEGVPLNPQPGQGVAPQEVAQEPEIQTSFDFGENPQAPDKEVNIQIPPQQ